YNDWVGYCEDGRAVENAEVETSAQGLDQLAQCMTHEEFRRVRWQLASRHDVEPRNRPFMQSLFPGDLSGKNIGKPQRLTRNPRVAVQLASPQIRINEADRLASLRAHNCKVRGDEALARCRSRTGDSEC